MSQSFSLAVHGVIQHKKDILVTVKTLQYFCIISTKMLINLQVIAFLNNCRLKWYKTNLPLINFLQFTSKLAVQILLVDFVRLLIPAMMGEQGQVPGRDCAHLHGAGRPLHSVEIVQVVV